MQDIQLSIIIPHYNSGELLEHLLSTIPCCEEIQVIVVDDHSTQQLEEYDKCKEKYNGRNIEFYDNPAGKKSAGAARNTGLKYAKGEWLLFADSDDYFLPEFYEKIKVFFKSENDIVYFSPTSIEVSSGSIGDRHIPLEKFVRNYKENPSLKNEVELKYSFVSPISKLIKHSLFIEHGIQFDEVMVANDVMASVRVAYYAKKIEVSTEKIYCITKQENSLETTISKERYDARMDIYFQKFHFLKEHLRKEEYAVINFKALNRLGFIRTTDLGWGYLLKILFRIHWHRVPIWREMGILLPWKH